MAAAGRSIKRAILTTALLLALPAGVAAQSAPDLEVAFPEVSDSSPVRARSHHTLTAWPASRSSALRAPAGAIHSNTAM